MGRKQTHRRFNIRRGHKGIRTYLALAVRLPAFWAVSGNYSYLVGESPTSPCRYHSAKGLIVRHQEMIHRSSFISIVVPSILILFLAACTSHPVTSAVQTTEKSKQSSALPTLKVYTTESNTFQSPRCYDIFDLTFKPIRGYENNFLDVDLQAIFTTPNGTHQKVNGFYYGENLWKIRFRPDEPGRWSYSYKMTDKIGYTKEGVAPQ